MTISELIAWRDDVAAEIGGYMSRGEYENSYHLHDVYVRLNDAVKEVLSVGAMKQLDVISQENPELSFEELVSEFVMNK